MPAEKGELDALLLEVKAARHYVDKCEQRLADAKARYETAWRNYAARKEVVRIETTVQSYSHLMEGRLVVERRARFCDISGEEIAPGTGAKLVLTQGDKRWEADVADSALPGLLDTLNNPEEKKKRGRPAADAEGAKPEAAAAKG